jgi:hypothetical protein
MLTQDEFEEIINDPSKRVDGDLQWTVDNNVLWAKFRAEVITDSGYDLFIQGSFNPFISGNYSKSAVTGRIHRLILR